MEEMKWYIFNDDGEPLCWKIADGSYPALQFDTKFDAVLFKESVENHFEDFYGNMTIKECIFFYDEGKLNASGWEVAINQLTGEEELVTNSFFPSGDVFIKCYKEDSDGSSKKL